VIGVAVVVGVLSRLHSPSALWLDEALSVAIARRPLPELFDALRRDGSPPLYYLVLHAWMAVFGESDSATRALSSIFSLATLPVVWLCGRRLGGRDLAWGATAILAVTPFAVRYATETRMYALVQLLVALGTLAVLRALERPSKGRLLCVSALAGALALTHYWALFLLAVTAAVLLGLALRGPDRTAARRTLVSLLAGGVLFLPWFANFVFQTAHTGTPWAPVPSFNDLYRTVTAWAGDRAGATTVMTLMLLALSVLGVFGHRARSPESGVVLGRPLHRPTLVLLSVAGGTLVLGLTAGIVVGAGYAPRYSSVALVPALMVAALGFRSLPTTARTAALAVIVATGLSNTVQMPFTDSRTQAAVTAVRISAALQPGDVVVYCPDQLGPSVSRRLPSGTVQLTYPLLTSPELIDWVDYAQRNEAADPEVIARELSQSTDGAVFVVWAPGYRTFGDQCEHLNQELAELRGEGLTIVQPDGSFGEQQRVARYPESTG
jgi:mannosyltransferase